MSWHRRLCDSSFDRLRMRKTKSQKRSYIGPIREANQSTMDIQSDRIEWDDTIGAESLALNSRVPMGHFLPFRQRTSKKRFFEFFQIHAVRHARGF